ncbi:MAG: glycosyltransferase family 2 protein [Chromatiales bacterium]|nr:glycosyltransferase family 2 protein [Chromatiales bacterium]
MTTSRLQELIASYANAPETDELRAGYRQLANAQASATELLNLYSSAAGLLSARIAASGYPHTLLTQQAELFQEMESQLQQTGRDNRYSFIIVIPVADRPEHLKSCLESLHTLMRQFNYGGKAESHYCKVEVLVADDSENRENRERIRKTTQHYDQQGLRSLYFGPEDQLHQLEKIDPSDRRHARKIVGDHPADAFHHKGASCTRNISYLKLNELTRNRADTLIWFIDSDQEFSINHDLQSEPVFAVNYFHEINQIFSNSTTQVLTGKVVGDPPVSPAVMGGNFLSDVGGFLSTIYKLDPAAPCAFHATEPQQISDAAYHDMAELFGFKSATEQYDYHCTLPGVHDNMDCLIDFTRKLNSFFDGQHPTRQTHYTYQPLHETITAARTVYTGNYILSSAALNHFIPFATLSLRMAGPVLGRLLKAELGDAFISANLPLLHKRTLDNTGTSEFRPGVDRERAEIDLSGEFEKQFFGDVMLFTIQSLIDQGYPHKLADEIEVQQTVNQTAESLLGKYRSKQCQIDQRIESLRQQIKQLDGWIENQRDSDQATKELTAFLKSMEYNFGEKANSYRLISDDSHRQARCREITRAILQYPADRSHWLTLLGR